MFKNDCIVMIMYLLRIPSHFMPCYIPSNHTSNIVGTPSISEAHIFYTVYYYSKPFITARPWKVHLGSPVFFLLGLSSNHLNSTAYTVDSLESAGQNFFAFFQFDAICGGLKFTDSAF